MYIKFFIGFRFRIRIFMSDPVKSEHPDPLYTVFYRGWINRNKCSKCLFVIDGYHGTKHEYTV